VSYLSEQKIDSISGLAGFAALMVIYAHMGSEGFLRLSHHSITWA